jgi:CTP synthase (UTP-ammonia lyase)
VPTCRIALIGNHDRTVVAHQAIPKALLLVGKELGTNAVGEWIHTSQLKDAAARLSGYDGVWCVPASPYTNTDGALAAIRFARESKRPYLGTCGGFQHAVIEYARNVTAIVAADNAETNPVGDALVISALSCSLLEKSEDLFLRPGSIVSRAYGTTTITESYHCSYGVNAAFVDILFGNDRLRPTAHDGSGQIRALELADHPFFVGTLFQPERRALLGEIPPLIRAFVQAASAPRGLAFGR